VKKKIKSILSPGHSEKGFVFALTLVFTALGFLIVTPLLMYMGTGLRTGVVFENRTGRLYSADAGIEDAAWQIKYNHLETTFKHYPYSPCDFDTAYQYTLPDKVNGEDVDVTIRNEWMLPGLDAPDDEYGRLVISGIAGKASKIVISSQLGDTYLDEDNPGMLEIKIQYEPEAGEELLIRQIGVWLPYGYSYRDDLPSTIDSYSASGGPDVIDWKGSQAVVWDLASYPYCGDEPSNLPPFPADNQDPPGLLDPESSPPLVSKIYFKFNAPAAGNSPQAVVWIDTNLDLSGGGGISYAWDGDMRIYHITSMAEGTQVDAYFGQNQLRKMTSAMYGDYYAIGNSLMVDWTPPISRRMRRLKPLTCTGLPGSRIVLPF
jgi:hypothetical protein